MQPLVPLAEFRGHTGLPARPGTLVGWHRRGLIRLVRVGRRWYVPRAEIERVVADGLSSETRFDTAAA